MSSPPSLPEVPPFPLLRGSVRDSFAFATIAKRMPVILSKVITELNERSFLLASSSSSDSDSTNNSASKSEIDGNADRALLSKAIEQLGTLKYEMLHNRPLRPLQDLEDDQGADALAWWNGRINSIPEKERTWLEVPWLLAECYMYRRIHETFSLVFRASRPDPFKSQKREALQSSLAGATSLYERVCALIDDASSSTSEALAELLLMSLWGNKMDLSLHANASSEKLASLQSQNKQTDDHILCNQSDEIIEHLLSLSKNPAIDIVLDNVGMELMSDLALCVFILSRNIAHTVRIHMKQIPWFVSDVMRADFDETMLAMQKGSTGPAGVRIHSLLQDFITSGRLVVRDSPYWTTPDPYWTLPQGGDSQLLQDLASSSLFLFKGDLNMRKLIWDSSWPHDTSFKTAIGPVGQSDWQGPAAIAALRALKADCVAGLDLARRDRLVSNHPDWMVNGDYAVILFTKRC